ncbi:hypothetical protein G9A89_001295, partial [Geosiphon pyriformis]
MNMYFINLVEYGNFVLQFNRQHPDATANTIHKEYLKTQQETLWINRGAMGNVIACLYLIIYYPCSYLAHSGSAQQTLSSQKRVFEKAFTVTFRDPGGYLGALCKQISQVAGTENYYNYLTIIQSSGYGKTRAGCELAAEFPFVYVCFRENGSTGYPLATMKSMDMLRNLNAAEDIDKAEIEALGWIQSIISTFHMKKEEFLKNRPQEKYQQALLKNQEQASEFWNTVNLDRGKKNMPKNKEKIILFIDEASALLSKKTDQVDNTNSSVANLAPQFYNDNSARSYSLKVHKPFIYLATMDCLSEDIPYNENSSGHDIIWFGRPLWGSRWQSAETWELDMDKFRNIIQLAKFKLLGGMNDWKQNAEIRRKAALTVIACITTLYISPVSSVAPDLIKSHMATLIAIDDDRKNHLITYPSEPVLAEAALEVLSENGLVVLEELDAVNKFSGIFDAGIQGELVVRLLFLSAWRRLICSERNDDKKVSFSVRRPVLNFLQELFEWDLPNKFSYLKDFEVGFTHFIGLTKRPDISMLKNIWVRRSAMHFKHNQQGSDFGLVIRHKTKALLRALVVQVKNHAVKQSKEEERFAIGCLLEPTITFLDDCANHIKDGYLGIYVQISPVDKGTPKLISDEYTRPNTRSSNEHPKSVKWLIVHGLGSFRFEHWDILENILCAWADPIRFCNEEETNFLYYMLPCVYGAVKAKRSRLQVSDEQGESSITVKKPNKKPNKK